MSIDRYNNVGPVYVTADNVNSEKSTIKKDRDLVLNISDPNQLDDFASYTALFTIS